ncbi:hypothetical protein PCANC_26012 [Puccinia coronata f. sp. avenae]|uniref:Uncharacterized protein n=1 Tax=Puccinia coronata f. sp. avenae TaxID=200324 RepID=A0A2N5TIN8_9BASI|nr:hypothetical protein PCANC_26012 [Puccinia coronata f. sp. avenae]
MTEAVCVKSQTQSIKGQLDSEGEVFYLMAASRPDLQFPFETRRAEQNVLPPSPTSASRKIVSLERNQSSRFGRRNAAHISDFSASRFGVDISLRRAELTFAYELGGAGHADFYQVLAASPLCRGSNVSSVVLGDAKESLRNYLGEESLTARRYGRSGASGHMSKSRSTQRHLGQAGSSALGSRSAQFGEVPKGV